MESHGIWGPKSKHKTAQQRCRVLGRETSMGETSIGIIKATILMVLGWHRTERVSGWSSKSNTMKERSSYHVYMKRQWLAALGVRHKAGVGD